MSKKRPGVAAGVRLAANLTDSSLWERVEAQYEGIRSESLIDAEKACLASLGGTGNKNGGSFEELTKAQMMDIVKWKFSVGKPRNQLLGLLRSNTDKTVIEFSKSSIQLAKDIQFQETVSDTTGELSTEGEKSVKLAMEELTKLKGVGPATATAVLCRVRPDVFCYMYDEVIDVFEPKRDYTFNVYLRINSKCQQLAHSLGEGWTTARVAKVLWTAARVLANDSDQDLTASSTSSSPTEKDNSKSSKEEEQPKQTGRKRRKTKK